MSARSKCLELWLLLMKVCLLISCTAAVAFRLFVGETDWKILAIDTSDPLADQMNGMLYHCTLLVAMYTAYSHQMYRILRSTCLDI